MARTIRRCPCPAKGDCKGDTRLNSMIKREARITRRREDKTEAKED